MGSVEHFFETARERYNIHRSRRDGESKPWTQDEIFQQYRFCNVFREDDKTTQWIRQHVREQYSHSLNLVRNIAIARWFNRIETLELLKHAGVFGLKNWDYSVAHTTLKNQKPIVTGAYVIKTPNGMSKLDGVLTCISNGIETFGQVHFRCQMGPEVSSQQITTMLQNNVPFLGWFMAYQIVADLQHTPLLSSAPDINTWAQVGPGSARGLGRIYHDDPTIFNHNSKVDQNTCNVLMGTLLDRAKLPYYWPYDRVWDMQTVQNWCCEYDKYCRAMEGGKMKRKYSGEA